MHEGKIRSEGSRKGKAKITNHYRKGNEQWRVTANRLEREREKYTSKVDEITINKKLSKNNNISVGKEEKQKVRERNLNIDDREKSLEGEGGNKRAGVRNGKYEIIA